MRVLLPSLYEIRLAFRAIRHGRAASTAIIVTLALAVGGTTAVFSVVHAVLMAPLPYANPDSLVRVWERHVPRNRDRNVVSPANFVEWRQRATTLTNLEGFSLGSASVTGDGAPERIPSAVVTWQLFDTLGVKPAIGRGFSEAHGLANAETVVLLSWEFWQRRYGADPAVIDRTLTINGSPARVLGVLPAGFRLLDSRRDLWGVWPVPSAPEPSGRALEVLARLAPGATVAQANAEMNTIMAALEEQWPDHNPGWRASVYDAREDLVGDLDRPLMLLLAAVAVVLLVGCANAANLLLARAADRQREFGVRAALGATGRHLLRQLTIEGAILAGAGTLAGLVVARLTLRLLVEYAGPAFGVPRLQNAQLEPTVLTVALGLLGVCTLVFALAPGWMASRNGGSPLFTGAVRAWTGGRLERRIRAGLVIVQVGFAVLLVIGAGLVARSLARLVSVSPGFDPEQVLTLTISLPRASYPVDEQVPFFEEVAQSLRALPGVETVGAIAWIPFGGPGGGTSFDVDGRTPLPAAERPVADIRPVDAEYFRTMRIPLRQGRYFTPAEIRDGARVTIVNETLVRRMFPDENPIGKRLQVNWNDGLDEIVGVVGDVKINGLNSDVRSQIYFPHGTAGVGFLTYVVRTNVDESSVARSAEAAIHAKDANLPVRDIGPLSSLIDDSVAAPSIATWLTGIFGGLALLLSLVGVAGLQAATVAARLPEFGIRIALGATPAGIRRLVLSRAFGLIGLGLGVGLVAAAAVSRALAGVLYDVPATDPLVYAGTAGAVLILGLAASSIAARPATTVDPSSTLRS